jgi:ferredoxin-thioredoxin reductase catalytic chain
MSTTEITKLSSDKNLKAMKNFSEKYAKNTGTYFCVDPSVTAVVIEGLAKHKDDLGSPLCPCRHYEDKEAEVKAAYWNCPCVPMQERKECHCMLFLTSDNEFAGDQQEISMEELQTARNTLA